MEASVLDLEVELRGDLSQVVARVHRGQHLLGGQQLHPRKDRRRRQRLLQHPVHDGDQRFAGLHQVIVLCLGYEIWAEKRTKKPSATRQLAGFHLFLKIFDPPQISVRFGFEDPVILVDCLV